MQGKNIVLFRLLVQKCIRRARGFLTHDIVSIPHRQRLRVRLPVATKVVDYGRQLIRNGSKCPLNRPNVPTIGPGTSWNVLQSMGVLPCRTIIVIRPPSSPSPGFRKRRCSEVWRLIGAHSTRFRKFPFPNRI
jgi:hypothetical protein